MISEELTPGLLKSQLTTVFNDLSFTSKVNFGFGILLRNVETEEVKSYYASSGNSKLLDEPALLQTRHDFVKWIDFHNVIERLTEQRESTKYSYFATTNFTVFATRAGNVPLAYDGIDLPGIIRNNRFIVTCTVNQSTGQPINDKLCMFRALAARKRMRRQATFQD